MAPINDYFPDESLLSVTSMLWFANIVNFLAIEKCHLNGTRKTKKKFRHSMEHYARTFIGMTFICSNTVLIKSFEDAYPTMR